MKKQNLTLRVLVFSFLFLGGISAAYQPAFGEGSANQVMPFVSSFPNCLDGTTKLQINNQRILEFKQTSPNQFLSRGFVAGIVNRVFTGNKDHISFEIQIGRGPNDTLEVIFNDSFGNMVPRPGMYATICGDYITSNAPTNRYPASPSGAIIHWVHENPDNQGHDHGFVELDGYVYGQASKEVLEYPYFPRFKQVRGVQPLFNFGSVSSANENSIIGASL